MPTISAGSSQTFTAGVKDQLFTLTANGGALGVVTGAATASFGPGAERRSFGPFAVGQAITVTVQAGSVIVEYGDATPENEGAASSVLTGSQITGGAVSVAAVTSGGDILLANGNVRPAETWRVVDGYPLLVAPDSSSGVTFTQQGGSTGFTTGYGVVDDLKVASITTGAGFWTEVNVPAFSRQVTNGRLCLLIKIDDISKLTNVAIYLGTAGYTNFYFGDYNVTSRLDRQYNGWMVISPELQTGSGAFKWSIGGGTPAFASTTFTAAKIRVTPVAGQQCTAHIAGIWVSGGQSEKPQILFTFDDGYTSAVDTGASLCEKYGFKTTQAIIASTIGTSTYATLSQIADAKARGHCIVAHGDPPTGNLAGWSTVAEIKADVQSNLNAISAITSPEERKCYVYPQGVHAHSLGDLRIQTALAELGIDCARAASENATFSYNSNDVWIADKAMRLPIIGHTYAGGSEATNISTIIARMQEAVAAGRDSIIMLHKVVTGTPATGIEIQDTNLVLILAAAAELVATGAATPGTLVTLRRKLRGGNLIQ